MSVIDLTVFPRFLQKHLLEHAGQPVVIGADGRATLPADLAEILGEAIGAEVATSIADQVKAPGRYTLPTAAQVEAAAAERATVARMGGNPFVQGRSFNLTKQIEVLAVDPALGKKLRAQAEADGVLAPGAVRG